MTGGISLGRAAKFYCLAVRVHRFHSGEIDTDEVSAYLNRSVGRAEWVMTSRWMFGRPPLVLRPGFFSAPVLCPEDVAHRLMAMDCEDHRPQRIVGDHVVDDVELAGWRQVAAQTSPQPNPRGLFPWEARSDRGAFLDA